MFKKLLIAFIIVVLSVCLVFAMLLVRQEDGERYQILEEANRQIAPIKQEIDNLYADIETLRATTYQKTDTPARVIYGFYAQTVEELQDEGAIILDANASEELVNAATDTGRDILCFFSAEEQTPQWAELTILRSSEDTAENRESISGMISCYVENAAAGILEDGQVNVPYIYIKSDQNSIEERLDHCEDVLLIIFNPGVSENLNRLNKRLKEGVLESCTVAEAESFVRDLSKEERIWNAERNTKISEMETRIEDLQNRIDLIYAQSKEARAIQKAESKLPTKY